jgi:hypothetical protein
MANLIEAMGLEREIGGVKMSLENRISCGFMVI